MVPSSSSGVLGPSVGPQFALLSGKLGNLSFFLDSFEVVVEWFSFSHGWSLLHWRHLSVVRPASASVRYLSGLRAGDCGLQLRQRVHARVLMVACLPLLRVWRTAPSDIPLVLCASTGIFSSQSWPLLDFPLCGFSVGLCRSSLASPSRCLLESAPALHQLISPHCGFVWLLESSVAIFLEVVTRLGFLAVPCHRHCQSCRASPPFLGHSPFRRW